MNTIIVVYSNQANLTKKEIGKLKKYAFNTASNLEAGTVIKSPDYSTNIVIVKILPRAYKYYNSSTGKLSNAYNSTTQWEIKELIIREDNPEAVYGSIVKQE